MGSKCWIAIYLRRESLRLNRSLSGLFQLFIIKLTVLKVKPFCWSRLKLVAVLDYELCFC